MSDSAQDIIQKLHRASQHLAQLDPQDEAVQRTVEYLQQGAKLLQGDVEHPAGFKGSFGENSTKNDLEFVKSQVDRLKSAAEVPAKRYSRVVTILAGLRRAADAADRPQFAALRPRVAAIVEKVAGVFAQLDTVEDLDKTLEQIESAVHSLYNGGKLNSPATYMFEQRGKGHHQKSE